MTFSRTFTDAVSRAFNDQGSSACKDSVSEGAAPKTQCMLTCEFASTARAWSARF